MRYLLLNIVLFVPLLGFSQLHTGDSTSLSMGARTILFTGGDAKFRGPLKNSGTITANRNIEFNKNTIVGSLKFVGATDQSILGDTITVTNFTLDKTGKLILSTGQVRVGGTTDLTSGVVESADELDLIQIGPVNPDGLGYVEGRMIGRLGNTNTFTFPMGLTDLNGNGYKNYITLTANSPGTFVRVQCRRGIPALLFPDDEMDGIAEEVEWVVHVGGSDSIQATVAIDYSGINLDDSQFPNLIDADIHQPAIAMFFREDTLHHALNTVTDFLGDVRDSDGFIESNERIWISNLGRRFSIALIPSAEGPVYYVPNAFAPNAVFEENRIFRPFFAGYGSETIQSLSITVYDSFNQEVFSVESEPGPVFDIAQYGWNGVIKNSGLDAPDGVYYYNISLITNVDEYGNPVKRQAVLLVR